jgi:hypothetical protein
MKKVKYRLPRRTIGPPVDSLAWDFGVEGVVLYKRPNDNKATWNVIHLASGLAIVMGEPKRDTALRAFLRFPPIDWTQDAEGVCLQLDMAYDNGTGRCLAVEGVAA